jgi:hypothetical protein
MTMITDEIIIIIIICLIITTKSVCRLTSYGSFETESFFKNIFHIPYEVYLQNRTWAKTTKSWVQGV